MDVSKLFDLAVKLQLPSVLLQGAAFLAAVRDNAADAEHVLTEGDWTEIEAIHARAIAAADELDAALALAERR